MNRVHLPPEIAIKGTFDLLPDTPNPEFATPREYAGLPFRQYGLAEPGIKIIDLMAGDGGTLVAALDAGTEVPPDAVEFDRDNFDRILNRMPPDTGAEIIHGDCMQATPGQMNEGYDAAVFSPPFVLMHELVNIDPRDFVANFHRNDLAVTLTQMVRDRRDDGKPGLVFIDSAIRAMRGGRELHPGYDTADYLTERYFDLCAVHRYRVEDPPPGCDRSYAWLAFKKRWNPDALQYLAVLDVEGINRRFHREALRALASVSFDGFNEGSEISAVGGGY